MAEVAVQGFLWVTADTAINMQHVRTVLRKSAEEVHFLLDPAAATGPLLVLRGPDAVNFLTWFSASVTTTAPPPEPPPILEDTLRAGRNDASLASEAR